MYMPVDTLRPRLVVDEVDNGKFRPERVKKFNVNT